VRETGRGWKDLLGYFATRGKRKGKRSKLEQRTHAPNSRVGSGGKGLLKKKKITKEKRFRGEAGGCPEI